MAATENPIFTISEDPQAALNADSTHGLQEPLIGNPGDLSQAQPAATQDTGTMISEVSSSALEAGFSAAQDGMPVLACQVNSRFVFEQENSAALTPTSATEDVVGGISSREPTWWEKLRGKGPEYVVFTADPEILQAYRNKLQAMSKVYTRGGRTLIDMSAEDQRALFSQVVAELSSLGGGKYGVDHVATLTMNKGGLTSAVELVVAGTLAERADQNEPGTMEKHYRGVLQVVRTLEDSGLVTLQKDSPMKKDLETLAKSTAAEANKDAKSAPEENSGKGAEKGDKKEENGAKADPRFGPEGTLRYVRDFRSDGPTNLEVKTDLAVMTGVIAGRGQKISNMKKEADKNRDAAQAAKMQERNIKANVEANTPAGSAAQPIAHNEPSNQGAAQDANIKNLTNNIEALSDPGFGATKEQLDVAATEVIRDLAKLPEALSQVKDTSLSTEERADLIISLARTINELKSGDNLVTGEEIAQAVEKLQVLTRAELAEEGSVLAKALNEYQNPSGTLAELVELAKDAPVAEQAAESAQVASLDGPQDAAQQNTPVGPPESASDAHPERAAQDLAIPDSGMSAQQQTDPVSEQADTIHKDSPAAREDAPASPPESAAPAPQAASSEKDSTPVADEAAQAAENAAWKTLPPEERTYPHTDGDVTWNSPNELVSVPSQEDIAGIMEESRQNFRANEWQTPQGEKLVQTILAAGKPEDATFDESKMLQAIALVKELTGKPVAAFKGTESFSALDALERLNIQMKAVEAGALGPSLKAQADTVRAQIDTWLDNSGMLNPMFDAGLLDYPDSQPPKGMEPGHKVGAEKETSHASPPALSQGEIEREHGKAEAMSEWLALRREFEQPKRNFLTDEKGWNTEHAQGVYARAQAFLDSPHPRELPAAAQLAAAANIQWLAAQVERGMLPGVGAEQAEVLAGKARSLADKVPGDAKLDAVDAKLQKSLNSISSAMREVGQKHEPHSAKRILEASQRLTTNERKNAGALIKAASTNAFHTGINAKDAKRMIDTLAQMKPAAAAQIDVGMSAKAVVGLKELVAEIESGRFASSVKVAGSVMDRAKDNLQSLQDIVRTLDPGNAKVINAQMSFDNEVAKRERDMPTKGQKQSAPTESVQQATRQEQSQSFGGTAIASPSKSTSKVRQDKEQGGMER